MEKGEAKEEKQPLLDPGSDSELDVEVLAPASAALNKSVTKSQRPEPTEYDRWVFFVLSHLPWSCPSFPDLLFQMLLEICSAERVLCRCFSSLKPCGCHCPLALQALRCLPDVCRWPRTESQGNCHPSVTAVPCLVSKQHPKGLIPVRRKGRSTLARAILCWAGRMHTPALLMLCSLWECCLLCLAGLAFALGALCLL